MSFKLSIDNRDGLAPVEWEVIPLSELDLSLLRSGRDLDIVVGPPCATWDLLPLLFGPVIPGTFLLQIPQDLNWVQLLVALGIFESKGQARKNWVDSLKRPLEIQGGFQDISIGKARRLNLWLWKPIPEKEEPHDGIQRQELP